MCSVALGKDGIIVDAIEVNEGYSHAEKLAPFVDQVLIRNRLKANDVDAVAVSKGPGSYTGLRIGVSLAKGLCFATGKPLISVETLQMMCLHTYVRNEVNYLKDALLCPMLDARRMEVYTALFDVGLMPIINVNAKILDEHSFQEYLDQEAVLFFGPGAEKFKQVTNHPSARFVDAVWPRATDMIMFSESKFKENEFENLAYFEPYYLKEFVSTSALNQRPSVSDPESKKA